MEEDTFSVFFKKHYFNSAAHINTQLLFLKITAHTEELLHLASESVS